MDEERARHASLAKVFEARQKAVKVSANSMYGSLGAAVASGAKYPCLAVSATTTQQGRWAMVKKKELVPQRFPGIDIVYGDTDSIMVVFAGEVTVEQCCAMGVELATFLTDDFQKNLSLRTMKIVFEKCFCPFLLEDKKRYMGLKFEYDDTGTPVCKGVDAKGVETERKDTLPYTKVVMRDVRDALMYEKDPDEAVRRFRTRMDALVDDKIPMHLLTIRKTLTSKVESKTATIAWAKVNADRRAREAGSEAVVNEQVEYVICNGPLKAKSTALAQDPFYAREQNLKLNRLWYFEHCIEEPIGKMFKHVTGVDYKRIAHDYKMKLHAERVGVDRTALQKWLKRPRESDPSA